jgi:hypothetical protein
MTNSIYNNGEYNGLNSTDAILAAIEQLASGSVLDETSDAYALWENGYSSTITMDDVQKLAFTLTDKDYLYWGDNKLTRNSDVR